MRLPILGSYLEGYFGGSAKCPQQITSDRFRVFARCRLAPNSDRLLRNGDRAVASASLESLSCAILVSPTPREAEYVGTPVCPC